MKKIIFIFLGILSIGLLLPNKVNAETNITNFEDTIKEEIKTFKGQSGTEEYIKKLESADLSNYKESDDKVNIYMFRGDTCSYCLKAVTYFSTIVDNYGDKFNLITYEVWKNSDNAKLMDEVAKTLGEEPNGVPYIIIGDKSFTGYSEEMNSQIESQINKVYKQTDRYDVMNNLDSGTTTIKEVKSNNTSSSSMVWLFILQIISILGLIIYVNKNNKNIKQKLEELEMKVNKNAKSKSKIIFIVVLVLCIFSFFAISKVAIIHNNDTDSIKFKEEYESLNGKKYKNKKIRDVKIEKDNPFVYKTAEEIVDLIENGESFIVYFGFSKCPWCRSMIETFIKTAKENNIDKIYYVDIEEIRNVIEYDKDGNLVTTKNGTPDYYDLVNKLNSVLNQYTLNNNGEEVAIGEKRIYAPNVVLVNNGEPVEMIDPIENIIKDPASEITKEQKEEMSNKIKCLFSCMKKGNTCSIKTKC